MGHLGRKGEMKLLRERTLKYRGIDPDSVLSGGRFSSCNGKGKQPKIAKDGKICNQKGAFGKPKRLEYDRPSKTLETTVGLMAKVLGEQ